MAIENERKYVLETISQSEFMSRVTGPHTTYHIRQGYLNDQTRIRQTMKDDELVANYFTFKQPVNGKLIEIETEITTEDFNALWVKVDRVINKVRIAVPHNDLTWEVDFLYEESNQQIYIVMAEVELPDGVEEPDEVPAFVKDHLVYFVPRHDRRFFNTQLVQPQLVKTTVKELKDGSKLHAS
jgi:CYTH domain-containing protein